MLAGTKEPWNRHEKFWGWQHGDHLKEAIENQKNQAGGWKGQKICAKIEDCERTLGQYFMKDRCTVVIRVVFDRLTNDNPFLFAFLEYCRFLI